MGQVLEGSGEKQEDQDHDPREDELGDLAACSGLLGHSGLGRAAVDHEGPAQGRGRIRRREAEDVGILIDPLVVANGKAAGRDGAFHRPPEG